MFLPRSYFVVNIYSLGKNGVIIDELSKQVIIEIKNKTGFSIGDKIINLMSFNMLGKMEWDFVFDNQTIFKLQKKFLESSIYLRYLFEGKYYDLFKIRVYNVFLPFLTGIKIESKDGLKLDCKKKDFLDYEIVDNEGVSYCLISKRGGFKEEYHVRVVNFLEGVNNYIFLSIPLIISVFY
ncbi:MAG: hypothetical protein ACK4GJ_00385 [bacterium]